MSFKKRKKEARKKPIFPTVGFVSVLWGARGAVGAVGRHRELRGDERGQNPKQQITAAGVCTSLEGDAELLSRVLELHREKWLLQLGSCSKLVEIWLGIQRGCTEQ